MSLSSQSGDYQFRHWYQDTSASTESFTLDRVGFLSGDQLDTDQVLLRQVTLYHGYNTVPEPSPFLPAAAAAGLALLRRRRPVLGRC